MEVKGSTNKEVVLKIQPIVIIGLVQSEPELSNWLRNFLPFIVLAFIYKENVVCFPTSDLLTDVRIYNMPRVNTYSLILSSLITVEKFMKYNWVLCGVVYMDE